MMTCKDSDNYFKIALAFLIGASIYLMWVSLAEYREGQKTEGKQHIELKKLAEENKDLSEENRLLSKQLIATEEINKKDFMREFQRDYLFQKAFESSLVEIDRLKKENKGEYEEDYARINSGSGATIARTVTDLIGRADTFGW